MRVEQSSTFSAWYENLRDQRAQGIIAGRIVRLREGNFGQAKLLGGGLSEIKINYGPGYRLYYTLRGEKIVLLLCGGDKSSQAHDIKRARALLTSGGD